MQNGLTTAYKYDKRGYYSAPVTIQVLDEQMLMPERCISTAPELLDGYFYKINEAKDGWVAEAKPKNASECVGLLIEHEDNSERAVELKRLMQELCDADAEHFKVVRGEDLSWAVEKIPEKTEQELELEALQNSVNERDELLNSLKELMTLAMLANDAETIATLQATYNEILATEAQE